MTSTPHRPFWEQWFTRLRYAAATALLVILAGGLVGLMIRDHIQIIALLIYVPLAPLGVTAVVWETAARGRALPKGRYILGGVGLIGIVSVCLVMTWPMTMCPATAPPAAVPLALIQWNVKWGGGGGGKDGSIPRWDSISRDIARHAPDIVVLSECPRRQHVERLERTLGPTSSSVRSEHKSRDRYYYRLVVASRWPVTMENQQPIPSGQVMQVVVAAPGGNVRVLAVDGQSHYLIDRTPRLRAIAQICREAERSGKPIDVIAGDFNAVGRSIGFDAIADAGFISAGRIAPGWRGTWPTMCPLYDIDHVWLATRWLPVTVERFTNSGTDHRGQAVSIVRR